MIIAPPFHVAPTMPRLKGAQQRPPSIHPPPGFLTPPPTHRANFVPACLCSHSACKQAGLGTSCGGSSCARAAAVPACRPSCAPSCDRHGARAARRGGTSFPLCRQIHDNAVRPIPTGARWGSLLRLPRAFLTPQLSRLRVPVRPADRPTPAFELGSLHSTSWCQSRGPRRAAAPSGASVQGRRSPDSGKLLLH